MDAVTSSVVEVRNDNLSLADISPLAKKSHAGAVMSFDPTTRAGAIMLIKAELLEQRELKELVNTKIKITHIYAKPIEDTDDQGEVNKYVRMVIFDDSGAAFSCGSRGVFKSLSVLHAIRGAMPWDPAIVCTVKLRSLEGKKQWMTLEPDMDSLFPASHSPPKK
jgi:hypothetical protein